MGFLQTRPNFALSELAAFCGFDFLMLDCEHGLFDDTTCEQTFQAVSGHDIACLVRSGSDDTRALGRMLDLGADGIIVPGVETPEQASTLAHAMHYAPLGTRGFGAPGHRVTNFGTDVPAHLANPSATVDLLLMIESAAAVANIDSILDVDGVNGVIVGPSDLSANLGALGDYSRPAYAEAIAQVEASAAKTKKLLGTAPHAGHPIEALHARGHRLFIIGADMSLIRDAMTAQVLKARTALDQSATARG